MFSEILVDIKLSGLPMTHILRVFHALDFNITPFKFVPRVKADPLKWPVTGVITFYNLDACVCSVLLSELTALSSLSPSSSHILSHSPPS